MSLGFFHNRLDWINEALVARLKEKVEVEVIDINTYGLDTHNRQAYPHQLYINRVYPSEAMTSYNNMRFMLEVVRHLENLRIPVINPFVATYADYSKTEANNLLESNSIPTARTILFSNKRSATTAGKEMSFPKIIKMDCGGKARNVFKASSFSEYVNIVDSLDHDHHLIHVEDFLQTNGFITRIVVLGYEVVHISKRTLQDGWLGSESQGSKVEEYENPPRALYDLGEKAAKALQAPILAFDVAETESGAFILDVNATPVFSPQSAQQLGFKPEVALADVILSQIK